MADLQALIAGLKSTDLRDRTAAADELNSLAEDASPAAIAVVEALRDKDDNVRQLVSSVLEGLGPPPQETVDDLERLLADPNADVAYWAATLLGRLEGGAIQAVEPLRQAASSHESPEVRKRATWALGKIASG